MTGNNRSLIQPFISVAVFFMLTASTAFATQYQSLFQGIRPLGMGGAFTAVADDRNALFYNPAGLSHIDRFFIGVDMVGELSESGFDLIEDIQDTDFENTDEAVEFLRDYVGEIQYIRSSFIPQLGFRVKDAGVMVSGIAQAKVSAEVHNPSWPELHARIIGDGGVIAGFGMAIPQVSGLRAGVTAKFIYRENLFQVYTPTEVAADDFDPFEDDRKNGSGISLDLGATYRLPFFQTVDTDLGICFQNFPDMDMGDAVDIDSQINLGVAVTKMIRDFRLIGAFDIRDITKNLDDDDDMAKRMYMGAEVQFPKILSLRAGLHQGYGSFGATIDFRFVAFDFASYVEEVGAYAGQRDDRRYVAQLMVGWM